VRQEALEHHPELKIRAPHVTLDTFSDSEEELALMHIPEANVIPTS
jgi:pterin-4a-carbinolamine dehydratase